MRLVSPKNTQDGAVWYHDPQVFTAERHVAYSTVGNTCTNAIWTPLAPDLGGLMSFNKWVLAGAVFLLGTPIFGSTYFAGLEDINGLDYDYNDVVFSLSGGSLNLNTSTGKWFNEPTLGTSQMPFWNRSSLDGVNYNVGYCIYGGGSCNGGNALDPGAKYLADSTSVTGSTNDVTFTSKGQVILNVDVQVTAGRDKIGWYSMATPGVVNWLNPNSTNGTYSFDPGGQFGLVGGNDLGAKYFSQAWAGTQDAVSHFAFFDPPAAVPEPGTAGLIALSLIGSVWFVRRQRAR